MKPVVTTSTQSYMPLSEKLLPGQLCAAWLGAFRVSVVLLSHSYFQVHPAYWYLLVFAGTLPKQSDLLHVGALGVCLFFSQLMYILGISLSGVLVATCMQPTIPVFTAMLAVCLQLESGSVQKFFGIGLAVVGSISMVSRRHTCAEPAATYPNEANIHCCFCSSGFCTLNW